jgi:hypothetical protein
MNSTDKFPSFNDTLLEYPLGRRHTVSVASHLHWRDLDTESLDRRPCSSNKLPKKNAPGGPPYHVFDHRQKLFLVYIVSFAGFFSPLSSNIYFPAIEAISQVGWHIYSTRIEGTATNVRD